MNRKLYKAELKEAYRRERGYLDLIEATFTKLDNMTLEQFAYGGDVEIRAQLAEALEKAGRT